MKLKSTASAALALALALGIIWSGAALSGWARARVLTSAAYRQSVIISSVFSQDDSVGLSTALTDAQARSLLLKFARALMDAYVSFELIPYGQLETFGVVYASLGPNVEINSFAYRGHDLIITGSAPDEESYRKFMAGLDGSGHFSELRGSFSAAEGGGINFEIECIAPVTHGFQVLPASLGELSASLTTQRECGGAGGAEPSAYQNSATRVCMNCLFRCKIFTI